MFKNLSFIKGCGELLGLGLVAGVLVVGCGGGGGGGTSPVSSAVSASPSNSALGSLIADTTGTALVGWLGAGNAPASAVAGVTTLAATSTANTYNLTYAEENLTGTNWASTTSPVVYDLIASGWIASPATATVQDSGDGSTATITPTGEPAYTATISKASLTGTAIQTNSNIFYLGPAAGAQYSLGAESYTVKLNVDWYNTNATVGEEVTDISGAPLIVAPTLNSTTFCDRYTSMIFEPNGASSGNNYNVFSATDCTSGTSIASDILSTPLGTVLITEKSTGSTPVGKVLLLTNPVITSTTKLTNVIFALNNINGYFYYGWMTPAGSAFKYYENRAALDDELNDASLTLLP